MSGKLRRKAVRYTDERVHLTSEILNGIRVIKYNGWVAPFLRRIADLRKDEIHKIKKSSFIRSATSTIRVSILSYLVHISDLSLWLSLSKILDAMLVLLTGNSLFSFVITVYRVMSLHLF